MRRVKIVKISSLRDLRNEIAGFSNTALDAVQTLRQCVNEQYNEMRDIISYLQSEQNKAYQNYLSAKEAYSDCNSSYWEDENGYKHYPDCSDEREERDEAWDTLKDIESDLKRAKEVTYKANDWLRSFNNSCHKFQSLVGNCSQNAIKYLDELFRLSQQYVIIAEQYAQAGAIVQYSNSSSEKSEQVETKGIVYSHQQTSNVETSVEPINFINTILLLKTTRTKNLNNKDFTTWSIASKDNPDESLLMLKMNNETKHATLGDVKTKDTFLNISKERDAICLMEKVAKKEGCKTISSWISNDQTSFFVRNGYEIRSTNESGAEIFKVL